MIQYCNGLSDLDTYDIRRKLAISVELCDNALGEITEGGSN